MGQYFRTAKPTFVEDRMFTAPINLIGNAIKLQDEKIDNAKKSMDELELLYKQSGSTDIDSDVVKQRKDQYRKAIETISQGIYGNMEDYKKMMPSIQNLSINLEDELQNGLLGRANENYLQRENKFKEIQGLPGISNERKLMKMQNLDKHYKESNGLNYTDKFNYNPYLKTKDDEILLKDWNHNAEALKVKINPNKDLSLWANAKDGYFHVGNKTVEGIDKARALAAANAHIEASNFDETWTQWYKLKGENNPDLLQGKSLDDYVKENVEHEKDIFRNKVIADKVYHKQSGHANIVADSAGQKKLEELNNIDFDSKVTVDRRTEKEREDDNARVADFKKYFHGFNGITLNDSEEDLIKKLGHDQYAMEEYLKGLFVTTTNDQGETVTTNKRLLTDSEINTQIGNIKEYSKNQAKRGYVTGVVYKPDIKDLDEQKAAEGVRSSIIKSIVRIQSLPLSYEIIDGEGNKIQEGNMSMTGALGAEPKTEEIEDLSTAQGGGFYDTDGNVIRYRDVKGVPKEKRGKVITDRRDLKKYNLEKKVARIKRTVVKNVGGGNIDWKTMRFKKFSMDGTPILFTSNLKTPASPSYYEVEVQTKYDPQNRKSYSTSKTLRFRINSDQIETDKTK